MIPKIDDQFNIDYDTEFLYGGNDLFLQLHLLDFQNYSCLLLLFPSVLSHTDMLESNWQ